MATKKTAIGHVEVVGPEENPDILAEKVNEKLVELEQYFVVSVQFVYVRTPEGDDCFAWLFFKETPG